MHPPDAAPVTLGKVGPAIVAAALVVTAGSVGAEHIGSLECGELAPFIVSCTEGPMLASEHTRASIGVTGFIGHIRVEFTQESGAMMWTECDVFLLPPELMPLNMCESGGYLVVGQLFVMTCRVSPIRFDQAEGSSDVGLGPLGIWGCKARS